MKLIEIYDKIFLNELMGFENSKPYSYKINGSIKDGWTITFKTTNNLDYIVKIDSFYYNHPYKFKGNKIYTNGYKLIDVTFKTLKGDYPDRTNKFDSRVLITVATIIKNIVLKHDIQLIEFFGIPKPSEDYNTSQDYTSQRTRIYKYIANIMKPNYYDIEVNGLSIIIYQKPEYYDKKRNIGKFDH